MPERVLVPIDQEMQIKEGWSQGFADLDVELKADNTETKTYINNRLFRGLPRLCGSVLKFTCEMPAAEIPEQFLRQGVFDLSLGAEVVRLTTGRRIANAVGFDENDTLHATASNLGGRTWIFNAQHTEEYTPPPPREPLPPFRLRQLFSRR